jgi:hypothetical protein
VNQPRNRNFALLFSAGAISYFGTYLAPIAATYALSALLRFGHAPPVARAGSRYYRLPRVAIAAS